jgi:hypothetical protein
VRELRRRDGRQALTTGRPRATLIPALALGLLGCAAVLAVVAVTTGLFRSADGPTTLFGSDAPRSPAAGDTGAVELGVSFTSSAPGSVVGLRFYKSRANTGEHTGTLWTAGGRKLAGLTFEDETASGWQTARFSRPVAVTPGRSYVASYHTSVGRYAADEGFFADGRDRVSPPLTATGSLYDYGARSAFPRLSYNGANYYVDVLFASRASSRVQAAPTPRPAPTPTPAPARRLRGFPAPDTVGVPAGWKPAHLRTSSMLVTRDGAVVQDVQFDGTNANLIIAARDVTVRRVKLRGGYIDNRPTTTCGNGLVVEDSTFEPPPGHDAQPADHWRFATGGYTARRVKLWHVSDGFRVGGRLDGGCGPVRIEDTFISVFPPNPCGDWHGDGIQGYDGNALTVRNVTIDMNERGCGGTAPFFYPSGQGNERVIIDRLLVRGGGYSFRDGMPGAVTGLRIVTGHWGYGPIDVRCDAVSSWDAKIVAIDSRYRVTRNLRDQPCDTDSGT